MLQSNDGKVINQNLVWCFYIGKELDLIEIVDVVMGLLVKNIKNI